MKESQEKSIGGTSCGLCTQAFRLYEPFGEEGDTGLEPDRLNGTSRWTTREQVTFMTSTRADRESGRLYSAEGSGCTGFGFGRQRHAHESLELVGGLALAAQFRARVSNEIACLGC